jgi:hypothetical protein
MTSMIDANRRVRAEAPERPNEPSRLGGAAGDDERGATT